MNIFEGIIATDEEKDAADITSQILLWVMFFCICMWHFNQLADELTIVTIVNSIDNFSSWSVAEAETFYPYMPGADH